MRDVLYLALSWFLALSLGCGVESESVGSSRSELRDLDTIEAEFLDLLNDYRVSNGRDPVLADRALNQGARDYSQLMGERNHFSHTGPDGSSFDERMCAAGYDPACGPRTWVAENIAAGQRTAEAVFEAWRTSPGHNANMLSSNAVVVGIGRAEVSGSRYGVYWTNTFGGTTTEHTVTPGTDAGPPPEPDAGPPPEADAGTEPTPEQDAGTVPVPGVDAGPEPMPGTDAGGTVTPEGDGGSTLPPGSDASVGSPSGPGADPESRVLTGGCAVTPTGGGGTPVALALGLIALAALRRRRG